jgi:hypothetical protein
MSSIFEVVGLMFVACAGLSLALVVINIVIQSRHDSYYRSLLDQLAEAKANMEATYKQDELMSAKATTKILTSLLRRYSPNIVNIRAQDDIDIEISLAQGKSVTHEERK